jgi:hypothetical protein
MLVKLTIEEYQYPSIHLEQAVVQVVEEEHLELVEAEREPVYQKEFHMISVSILQEQRPQIRQRRRSLPIGIGKAS